MVSANEARKLQQDFNRELYAKPAAAWKCAAGFVALMILVLVGTASHPERENGGGVRAARYLETVSHQAPAANPTDKRDFDQSAGQTELVRQGL